MTGRSGRECRENRQRSRAFDHLGLARTHLTGGEVERADEETRPCLQMLGAGRSRRVADRLGELYAEATTSSTIPYICPCDCGDPRNPLFLNARGRPRSACSRQCVVAVMFERQCASGIHQCT